MPEIPMILGQGALTVTNCLAESSCSIVARVICEDLRVGTLRKKDGQSSVQNSPSP